MASKKENMRCLEEDYCRRLAMDFLKKAEEELKMLEGCAKAHLTAYEKLWPSCFVRAEMADNQALCVLVSRLQMCIRDVKEAKKELDKFSI